MLVSRREPAARCGSMVLWTSKTETATRVRQRIEFVLDWATVSGFRKGDNPARWVGNLEHKLTNPAKLKNVENLPVLPFAKCCSMRLPRGLHAALSKLQAFDSICVSTYQFRIGRRLLNVAKPDNAANWNLRLQLQFLFPE
jgi:hypothetical protein